jgi:uncharacterized protein
MHPQLSGVLIGVEDMNRAKKFYAEGLGCPIDKDYPAFVSFKLGEGSSELGLYKREALAADAGVTPDGNGFRAVTFNYVVPSAERVDEVMALAQRAGAKIVKPAQKAQYGYFGYFSDPDGHLWKVAAGN